MLPAIQQVSNTLISLGEEKYAELSGEEQKELDFFIWVGCSCHKNLNSVSGGNAGMMSWWDENYVIGPISLANNNHYVTYCETAAMFMQHCGKFLQFLEFVRGSKENLYRTLQDPPTLTELAVLALYAKTTSHPYMCLIHGHDINMLDLGPLHTKVE